MSLRRKRLLEKKKEKTLVRRKYNKKSGFRWTEKGDWCCNLKFLKIVGGMEARNQK